MTCLTLLLSACSPVTSQQPLGGKPAAVRDLHPEGVWRTADGQVFFVRIADEAAGRLELATVKRTDHGFALEATEVLLRQEGEAVLANLRGAAPDAERAYMFGRLALNGDQAVLHLAASAPIQALSREEASGIAITATTNRVGGGEEVSVLVTHGFERLAAELASPAGWRLLDTQNPVVLMRQRVELD